MKDEEKVLLKQKWLFQKLKPLGNLGMGNMGLKVLDFRKDDVVAVEDGKGRKVEFNYTLVDKSLDLFFPATPKNILRLRISELTTDKLVVAISGRKGNEINDKFSEELMEVQYEPATS